ncbi:hypothetical protein [Actinocorallia sp. A-T 12471]|uniref:hypothetical protein n=1 Tax=Actinocorallia sp. A-T 12471 TaxID=3089813 RepID=UPI0029CF360F|nr:hypothetical protein [Actinocorallia sp. A-T 12471]MDX6739667.1 hypothetical protein [Actinocorallia sp. A-T 12471]
MRPRLLGLADGSGDGTGNGAEPGVTAVLGTGPRVAGTDLRTQPVAPDTLAGKLRFVDEAVAEVQAPGVPPVDGAPGGTLNGFKVLSDVLNSLALLGFGVDNPVEDHCFVPSASAVSIRDVTADTLHVPVNGLPAEESDFHDFTLAERNGPHTVITEAHARWLLDHITY